MYTWWLWIRKLQLMATTMTYKEKMWMFPCLIN
jgi:hypothetical protein